MTYKDVVNRFQEICNRHYQVVDFGYGDITDLKTANQNAENTGDDTNTDYPYVFLNPTNHSRTQQAVTYRFNLIVMDIALKGLTYTQDQSLNDVVTIQSNCEQIIEDIMADWRYQYRNEKQDFLITSVALTPFKERFQDTVAGMTAAIEIQVPRPLNACIVPIEPLP